MSTPAQPRSGFLSLLTAAAASSLIVLGTVAANCQPSALMTDREWSEAQAFQGPDGPPPHLGAVRSKRCSGFIMPSGLPDQLRRLLDQRAGPPVRGEWHWLAARMKGEAGGVDAWMARHVRHEAADRAAAALAELTPDIDWLVLVPVPGRKALRLSITCRSQGRSPLLALESKGLLPVAREVAAGRWDLEIGTSTDEKDATAFLGVAYLLGFGAFI